MSSMVRTIRRGMRRETALGAAQHNKLICPKCKQATLEHKNLVSRKMTCPNCGWKGRIK